MSTNSKLFTKKILTKGLLTFMMVLLAGLRTWAADPAAGETIFKANCTACHAIDKRVIGPPLKDVQKTRDEAWLVKWIHDSQALIKSGDTAAINIFNEYNQIPMTAFPNFTVAEIQDIIAYIEKASNDLSTPKAAGASVPPMHIALVEQSKTSTWLLVGVVVGFLLLIIVLATVLLKIRTVASIKEKEHLERERDTQVKKQCTIFSKKKYIALAIVVITIVGAVTTWNFLWEVGIKEGYQPEQPIAFSHKVHAGVNQIDCQYCHSGAWKSKNASIPSANVCMNCHNQITSYNGAPLIAADGHAIDGTAEIQKIYAALNYDPTTMKYGNNPKPIEWVRVHDLQDFVYFNHAQHVKVGADAIREVADLGAAEPVCKACHGDVASMDEVYQASQLTMKWCINCHRSAPMTHAPSNHYYDGMIEMHEKIKNGEKVTVADMGGLECSKCHY